MLYLYNKSIYSRLLKTLMKSKRLRLLLMTTALQAMRRTFLMISRMLIVILAVRLAVVFVTYFDCDGWFYAIPDMK